MVMGPSEDKKGLKFVPRRIFIGGTIDRCFQKWRKKALSGKNIKVFFEFPLLLFTIC